SLPHVPAGYYWLQLKPTANYWTSTSAFDAGEDFIRNPIQRTTSSTTTLNIGLTNADPIQTGDHFSMSSNAQGFPDLSIGPFGLGSTTVNLPFLVTST